MHVDYTSGSGGGGDLAKTSERFALKMGIKLLTNTSINIGEE